jgi:hypothetical protein
MPDRQRPFTTPAEAPPKVSHLIKLDGAFGQQRGSYLILRSCLAKGILLQAFHVLDFVIHGNFSS